MRKCENSDGWFFLWKSTSLFIIHRNSPKSMQMFKGHQIYLQFSNTLNFSMLVKVYKESALSLSTVKKWAPDFGRGRNPLEDDVLQPAKKPTRKYTILC